MLDNTTTNRAETVEKAIKLGLTKLNATEDQVTVNVISEGKKGIFGFGKQDAIVELTLKSTKSISELTKELETQEVTSVIDEEEIKEVPVQADFEENEVEVNETKIEAREAEVEANEVKIEAKESKIEATEAKIEIDEEEYDETPISDSEIEKSRVIVAKYLEDVINDFGAPGTVTYEEEGNQVIFNIDTQKSGLVIGKHGRIINALQILAQVMLHQYDRRRMSVIINVGDYRDRRAGVLEQMAERTAKQVLRTKQSVILDPLPSYERKQIHAYLSKVDHIKTHSEGKDPNRYLVVEYSAI